MNIEIAQARPEDAAGIQEVIHTTWLSTYPNEEYGITLEDIKFRHQKMRSDEGVQKLRNSLENPEQGETTLVAKLDDKVIGVCVVIAKGDRNQLQAIYILPEYQHRGIGHRFWQEVHRYMSLSKDTYVEVVEYNSPAINFYKKLGFVDTGRRFKDERFTMRNGNVLPEMEMVLKAV